MADTLFSYANLPIGLNMYHLQVELSAVPNYPIQGLFGTASFTR